MGAPGHRRGLRTQAWAQPSLPSGSGRPLAGWRCPGRPSGVRTASPVSAAATGRKLYFTACSPQRMGRAEKKVGVASESQAGDDLGEGVEAGGLVVGDLLSPVGARIHRTALSRPPAGHGRAEGRAAPPDQPPLLTLTSMLSLASVPVSASTPTTRSVAAPSGQVVLSQIASHGDARSSEMRVSST